jgi:hypothetical protein
MAVMAGDSRGRAMTDLATAAEAAAARGWEVFPCIPQGKRPATRHGFLDATAHWGRVRAWWRAMPRANLGHPTGLRWDVLDLDRRPGCDATELLPRLRDAGWLAGAAGAARTRNGGVHLFFPTGGGRSGAIPALAVDWKAAGGYVLLAPSRVPADMAGGTGTYEWATVPTPGTGRPLDWPALAAWLSPTAPTHDPGRTPTHDPGRTPTHDPGRRLAALCARVAAAAPGERNRMLFWAACRLSESGQLDDAAAAALGAAAESAGLGAREVRATLQSARRTGAGR